jgi:O-antigen/teichoic acid export membrane protein
MKAVDFVKNAATTLLTRVVVMALTFLTGVVAARALGPKGVGAFSLAILFPLLVSLVFQFGLGAANIYFIGHGTYPVETILANSLSVSLITSVVIVPLYLALIPLLQRTVAGEIDPAGLRLVAVAFPLALIGGHLSNVFLGLHRVQEYNFLNLIRNGSMLVLILLFVVVFHAGVMGALAAMCIAWALMVARGFWALRGSVRVRLGIDWPVLADCLALGVKGYLANLFQFFNYRLDVLIVSYFLGITQVGLYTTAVAAGEMLWYTPEAIATVLFPRTASASPEEARTFTPLVSRQVFAPTLVIGILLAVFSRPVILLIFSGAYSESISTLRLLLPGVILLALGKVLAGDLAGRGLLLYNTIGSCAALIATVICDLLLIPRLGINGAAIASSVSYALTTGVLLFFYTRVSGNRLADLVVPRVADWRLYHEYFQRFYGVLRSQ